MTDAVVHRCPDCKYSYCPTMTGPRTWFCHHPRVNRARPSFLAGNNQAAIRCTAERMNILGYCGCEGKLFESTDHPPLESAGTTGLEALPWKLPDADKLP